MLICCVTSFSSGAAAYDYLEDVPPVLFTAWRMELSSIGMMLISLWDVKKYPRRCIEMFGQAWHLLLLGGLFFGIFFNLYNLALSLTSIAHAILAYSACPVYIFIINYFQGKPVYKWEAIGSGVSIAGICLIVFSSGQEISSTWYGDLVAIVGAFFLALYTLVSQTAMKDYNCPISSYLAVSSLISLLVCLCLMALLGQTSDLENLFGWTDKENVLTMLYVSIIVGCMFQIIFNGLLKYLSAVLVTVFVNLEPLTGSLIGWLLNLQGVPSIYTWIGGSACIIGSIIVTLCGSDNQKTDFIELSSSQHEIK